MLLAVAYFAAGFWVMHRLTVGMPPKSPSQALSYLVILAFWPIIVLLQISERVR